MFNSLRARLIIINLGLIVLGFGALTLWAGRQMAQATWDDYSNTQRIVAIQLANVLVEPVENNSQQFQTILNRSAENLSADITLFNPKNQPVYSTSEPLAYAAQATYIAHNGWVHSSAEIIYEGEVMLGTVQIATDGTVPANAIRQRWLELGAAFVGFSAIGALITAWLLGTLTRPLASLRRSALQIADGDLNHRATDLPDNEIGAVGTAFNTMAERVTALIDEQRAFASNASHELRTPLTTVRLRTEALQNDLEPAIQAQYIQEIDSEVHRLSKLVDDLLLLSRLDAKRLESGSERLDLIRIVKAVGRELAPIADEKSIAYTVSTAGKAMMVTATLTHMQVVLRNVIDNAIKYTPSGGEVSVGLHQEGETAVIYVVDSGRGISAENLPSIGKRFYRTDQSRNRETAGTGLGLALVQSITDLYNGQLDIKSEGIDQGTAVTIRWPLSTEID